MGFEFAGAQRAPSVFEILQLPPVHEDTGGFKNRTYERKFRLELRRFEGTIIIIVCRSLACPPSSSQVCGGRPVFATGGWELEDSRCVDVLLPGLHRCLPMDVTLSGRHRGNFMSMTVVGCRRHPRLGRGSPRVARMTLDVIRVPREDAV